MAGSKDVALKTGKTTFSSQQDAVFRFSVFPEKIWFERQATKQQWRCTVSSVHDFALKGACIPHDIVMDYLAMSLDRSKTNRQSDFEVDLLGMGGGRMRLDLSLKFSIAGRAWKPEYQFVLEPIEVTETQRLLAELREVEESLELLRTIVPAWVLTSTDPSIFHNETALQIVALKGIKFWLYLCSLAKWLLEDYEIHAKAVEKWSVDAARKSGNVAAKYWSNFTDEAANATESIKRLLSVKEREAGSTPAEVFARDFLSHLRDG